MGKADGGPPGCVVLHASWADMGKPFEAFIEKHERRIAAAGLAKVIPPPDWTPCKAGYPDTMDGRIERCIKQVATGSRGLFRFLLVEQKPMSLLKDFRPEALAADNQPGCDDPADVERKYWRGIALRAPKYGADISGSLFDDDVKGWDLRRLDTLLSRTLAENGMDLPGVTSPYLYYGMWRATFAWHCEDMDLYSVNFLHYGAPKYWYGIAPEHRARFETLVRGMLPDLFRHCPEFMRHKDLLISPALLDQHKIPYIRVIQQPREFMITYPGAYHAGFNAGYNCAESVNFGTRRWIPIGSTARHCECTSDTVKMDMRIFRHLVPMRLLPPAMLEDTSDEDEDGNSESSQDGSEASSGSNTSSHDVHQHQRLNGGPASGSGAAGPQPAQHRQRRRQQAAAGSGAAHLPVRPSSKRRDAPGSSASTGVLTNVSRSAAGRQSSSLLGTPAQQPATPCGSDPQPDPERRSTRSKRPRILYELSSDKAPPSAQVAGTHRASGSPESSRESAWSIEGAAAQRASHRAKACQRTAATRRRRGRASRDSPTAAQAAATAAAAAAAAAAACVVDVDTPIAVRSTRSAHKGQKCLGS